MVVVVSPRFLVSKWQVKEGRGIILFINFSCKNPKQLQGCMSAAARRGCLPRAMQRPRAPAGGGARVAARQHHEPPRRALRARGPRAARPLAPATFVQRLKGIPRARRRAAPQARPTAMPCSRALCPASGELALRRQRVAPAATPGIRAAVITGAGAAGPARAEAQTSHSRAPT